MKKIPTIFERDWEGTIGPAARFVLKTIHPGCEWVFENVGSATRKYDGTCVMFDGVVWWARREVRGNTPHNFIELSLDEATGKTIGWEPIAQSPFVRFHAEAISQIKDFKPGTYELCGPKINKNPEGYLRHVLVPHCDADTISIESLTFDGIRDTLVDLRVEGIVWHHPDGRMAKIKLKDFGLIRK